MLKRDTLWKLWDKYTSNPLLTEGDMLNERFQIVEPEEATHVLLYVLLEDEWIAQEATQMVKTLPYSEGYYAKDGDAVLFLVPIYVWGYITTNLLHYDYTVDDIRFVALRETV